MKAMKKFKTTALCTILSGSLLFSSCIGSFGLWNTLKNWNENTGNKFVNEIVFLAFHIIPVYEFAYLADIIVLNSIEFWTGSNPVAEVGNVKTIKGENGEYLVQTNENGYTIIKKGEEKHCTYAHKHTHDLFNQKKVLVAIMILGRITACAINHQTTKRGEKQNNSHNGDDIFVNIQSFHNNQT